MPDFTAYSFLSCREICVGMCDVLMVLCSIVNSEVVVVHTNMVLESC